MKLYLGLGSNLGDRRMNLERAIASLAREAGPVRVSSVYETPALLPEGASDDWNLPFLNLALEVETDLHPRDWLLIAKRIERELGRDNSARWSPRPIDIDLLHWEGGTWNSDELTLPHPRLQQRAFVLDPLAELAPQFLPLARTHPDHVPALMGILNLTPDSFSDGGVNDSPEAVLDMVKQWEEIAFFDLGAESTRPGATPADSETEWRRLEPVLGTLVDRFRSRHIRPCISVDTRHAVTAKRALALGADLVNDVGGLSDPSMLELIATARCPYVLTHNLALCEGDAATQLATWFLERIRTLEDAGLPRSKIILDPGIGFGKTSTQSMAALKAVGRIENFGCRLLVGHSRKSFFRAITANEAAARDTETLGASFTLAAKGIDILRVHAPLLHKRAFLARSLVR